MDLQDHHLILALIACAAVLGLAVGYCIEVLRSSSREATLADAWEKERVQLNAAIEKQKASTQTILAADRKKSAGARVELDRALARHKTMQMHTDVQAQKITNLEAELRAAEERNIKLQSDFASYKSNKDRELEVLRTPQHRTVSNEAEFPDSRGPVSTAERLPVLSKRVSADDARTGDAPIGERLASRLHLTGDTSRLSRKRAVATAGGFSAVLSDTEIPTLAESELPDAADELDFAALLGSDDEAASRG